MKQEILPPETAQVMPARYESFWFDDARLDVLAHWLDDCFKIPGLPFRFGIDAFIGLVPGVGDLLTGLLTCIILLAGWMRGLPYVTLLRMLANIAIDVVIGAVPVLGDVFDIAWKPNRRNFALLQLHIAEPRKHTRSDWVFLLGLGAAIFVLLAAPLVVLLIVLIWVLGWLGHSAGHLM